MASVSSASRHELAGEGGGSADGVKERSLSCGEVREVLGSRSSHKCCIGFRVKGPTVCVFHKDMCIYVWIYTYIYKYVYVDVNVKNMCVYIYIYIDLFI